MKAVGARLGNFMKDDYTNFKMKPGKWLAPCYPSREIFEKDYPKLDMSPMIAGCPGCTKGVRLGRKAVNGRIGGWCKACSRAVAP